MSLYSPFPLPEDILAFWSEEALLREMLCFEKQLAICNSEIGLYSAEEGKALFSALKTVRLDAAELRGKIESEGNLAIPFVKTVRDQLPGSLQNIFHYGATSQDVIDTALYRLSQKSIVDTIRILDEALVSLEKLTRKYAHTLMMAKTLYQSALPTTFGFKCAGYLDAFLLTCKELRAAKNDLPVEFGGAVGTHAAIGEPGLELRQKLSEKLGLKNHPISLHTNRLISVKIFSAMACLFKSTEKIATDLLLLLQSGVGEIEEASSGSSSAMPHKRNPVKCNALKALSIKGIREVCHFLSLPSLENERGAGTWHAEWETFREIHLLCQGTAFLLEKTLRDLQVHPEKMSQNLAANQGFEMSENLAVFLKKKQVTDAKQKIEGLCLSAYERKMPLLEAVRETDFFSEKELTELFTPKNVLGTCHAQIEAVLQEYRQYVNSTGNSNA